MLNARFRSLALAVLAAAVFAVTGAALAQQGAAKGRELRPDLIYHNYCSVCHGDRGDGRSRARNSLVPPPRDFTVPDIEAQLAESHRKVHGQAAAGSGASSKAHVHTPREHMIEIVTHGKPGTAMVSWTTQLTKPEIEAVVDYVIATFMKKQPQKAGTAPLTLDGVSGTHAHGGRARDPATPAKPTAPAAARAATR